MSRYQAYPEYKDSGVEWLGRRPSHWISTAIKYGYEITLGKMLQKEKNLPSDEFKPYLKAVNIQPSGVSISSVEEMWFSIHELRSLRLRKGDLLISEGGDVGRSAIWNDELPECYIQNAINRARPRRNQSSSFLYYWMMMLKESSYIEVLCNKATIAHYTVDKLESSPLFLPPDSEAETIAAFLDHETAKIDDLIEKQQRLIELLKEKRQAVISHAVTKGLNPNARMKDSGVEWLSEVPAHWEVSQLRYVVREGTSITYGIVQAGPEVEEGVPYIRTSDMSGDALPLTGYPKTSPEIDASYARSRVSAGDLVISIRASVGKCLPVPPELDGANLTQGTAKIAPSSKALAVFMLPFIGSSPVQLYLDSKAKGATFKEITLETLRKAPFLVPPVDEQNEIGRWVDSADLRFKALIEAAEQAQLLLKERRIALISAAVTGKIDVRDWQAAA